MQENAQLRAQIAALRGGAKEGEGPAVRGTLTECRGGAETRPDSLLRQCSAKSARFASP